MQIATGSTNTTLQGLTLVRLSAQREHFLCDTLDSKSKSAQVELRSGRV